MGELMPGIPNLPGDETTWQAFTDQFETLKKGDKPISLTNWDNTDTVPAVAAGSALEIAGATYRFPSESAISAESGLAAGVVYVVVKTNDPDANSATAYFTNTTPEWRDDLNGWYDTTGANRYTGHLMDWDGASAYTKKRVFTASAKGGELTTVYSTGTLSTPTLDIFGAYSSFEVDLSNTTWAPMPEGFFIASKIFSDAQGGIDLRIRAQIDGGFEEIVSTTTQDYFMIFSTGDNHEVHSGTSTSGKFYFIKIG